MCSHRPPPCTIGRPGLLRLADTLLAPTFLQSGVRRLATCNRADFEAFPDLELIDPRIPAAG